jgi:hypothetical protein
VVSHWGMALTVGQKSSRPLETDVRAPRHADFWRFLMLGSNRCCQRPTMATAMHRAVLVDRSVAGSAAEDPV